MSLSCRELDICCKSSYGPSSCLHALEESIIHIYHRMLAVMTFNAGYFLSVLGGIFLGELAVGRYAELEEH